MNKVENTPLEKRNKEHYENLVGWKRKEKDCNGQEVHASTPVERDAQGTIKINTTTLRLEMEGNNMELAKWKHLDETPVRRGLIATTLRLKQDREGKRMI